MYSTVFLTARGKNSPDLCKSPRIAFRFKLPCRHKPPALKGCMFTMGAMDEHTIATRIAKAMRGAIGTMRADLYQSPDPEVLAWLLIFGGVDELVSSYSQELVSPSSGKLLSPSSGELVPSSLGELVSSSSGELVSSSSGGLVSSFSRIWSETYPQHRFPQNGFLY